MPDLHDFVGGLPDLSKYGVNQLGEVYNFKTRKLVHPKLRNHETYLTVQLRSDTTHRFKIYSVARLVADTFLPSIDDKFDSVIRHNGDPNDCRVSNLSWRPRWFAMAYHRDLLHIPPGLPKHEIYNKRTGQQYNGILDVVITHGVLMRDVADSLNSGWPVFPQRHVFTYEKPGK